jgi:peptide/nickel transport system substrate-binding protein
MAVAAVVAVGCSSGGKPEPQKSGQSSESAQVVEGGTLRVGTTSTIDSLNPFVGFQGNSFLVWQSTWPYLATYDDHNKIVPFWATSWDVSSDGLTYTFHLHPNTKWSDGQPMTASDAAFTINTIIKYQKGPTGNLASNVTNMKDADAPDPATVVVHYAKPAGNALSQFAGIPILPEHVWGKYATGDGKALKTSANEAVTPTDGHPVVSGGPFMLTEYKKDDIALMQQNPNYTLSAKPHIDGFGIQIYSDEDSMITALKNGDLDAVEGVPTTTVASLKSAGFAINDTPGVFFYDFIINSNPKKPEHRELLDPKVKEALEYAIDRQQIINVALGGYGTPGASIVPPATGDWSDPNVKPLPFDIDQANKILDSLGYQRGAGGIRVADGHPMEYSVIIPTSQQAVLTRTFQIIQPDFQQIGVKLTLKALDASAAFDAIGAPNYKYLNFDLAMWDWIPFPDPSYILNVVMCDQYGSNSDSGYCNPAYDKMWNQQASTVDQTKRRQIVYQMQEILANDRPYIVLNYPDVIDAYNSDHWAGFYNETGFGIFINNAALTMNFVHQT